MYSFIQHHVLSIQGEKGGALVLTERYCVSALSHPFYPHDGKLCLISLVHIHGN